MVSLSVNEQGVFQSVWLGDPAFTRLKSPTREKLMEGPGRRNIYLLSFLLTYSHQYFCLWSLGSDPVFDFQLTESFSLARI